MISSVSLSQASSHPFAFSKPISFAQLFELKASKLKDEYLKNRGSEIHYRSWLSYLASAQRWERLRETILLYRHDAPEFDAINAFYLAKIDKEFENNHQAAFDLMLFYHLSLPKDVECVFFLSSLAVEKKGSIIDKDPLSIAIRLILNNLVDRLQKEHQEELSSHEWLKTLSLFMDPLHAPVKMERVPVFIFIEILKQVVNRSTRVLIPAFEEEIPLQLKQNTFDARLLGYVLQYYVYINDHAKADQYAKLLYELALNPSHEVLFSLSKYEISKANLKKAHELLCRENAHSLSCYNLRLTVLSKMGCHDEWMQVFEKADLLFNHPAAFNALRVYFLQQNLKKCFEENKLELAEKYAEAVLNIDPKNPKTLHTRILISLKQKNYKEAWLRLKAKTDLAPSDNDPFISTLIAKRSYERLKETEDSLRTLIFFNPDNHEYKIAIIDIFICQSKYSDALEMIARISKLDENQIVLREIIRLRLDLPPIIPVDKLKSGLYLDWYLAERKARLGAYEDALKGYGAVSPEADIDTIKFYLQSLMGARQFKAAKEFLARLDDNRKLRLNQLKSQIEAARIIDEQDDKGKAVNPPQKAVTEEPPKKIEVKEKVLIGLTPEAISLLKQKVTRKPCCGKEGVDPLHYPKRYSLECAMASLEKSPKPFEYYSDAYFHRVKAALNLFERLKEVYKTSQTKESAYLHEYYISLILDALSPTNPSPDQRQGMRIFSSRVYSTDELSALKLNLIHVPAQVSDTSLFKLAKSLIDSRFEHAITMSFSDPEPVQMMLPPLRLENGEDFFEYKDHIQVVLHFDTIRNELAFLTRDSNTLLNEKDPEESVIPYKVSASRILRAIEFIEAFDEKRGEKLKAIFPELELTGEALYDFSIQKLNRLIALAKNKAVRLEKV